MHEVTNLGIFLYEITSRDGINRVQRYVQMFVEW